MTFDSDNEYSRNNSPIVTSEGFINLVMDRTGSESGWTRVCLSGGVPVGRGLDAGQPTQWGMVGGKR